MAAMRLEISRRCIEPVVDSWLVGLILGLGFRRIFPDSKFPFDSFFSRGMHLAGFIMGARAATNRALRGVLLR